MTELEKGSFNGLSWLHFQNLHSVNQLAEGTGWSCEHGKSREVHGDYCFCLQQIARIRGLAGREGHMANGGEHGAVGGVEAVDDFHVPEDIGVAGMINLEAVLQFDDV